MKHLQPAEVRALSVLEVGSRDVNGSLRHTIEPLKTASYTGIDIERGPGVDELCSVHGLVSRFSRESMDMVVCTEVIEHVRDWRSAISELKNVLKPGGILLVTTRSHGFPYHDYPADFWRYELEDMRELFADLDIEVLETDRLEPGVLMKARKPRDFRERALAEYRLYSMITGTRRRSIGARDLFFFTLKKTILRRLAESIKYRFGQLTKK